MCICLSLFLPAYRDSLRKCHQRNETKSIPKLRTRTDGELAHGLEIFPAHPFPFHPDFFRNKKNKIRRYRALVGQKRYKTTYPILSVTDGILDLALLQVLWVLVIPSSPCLNNNVRRHHSFPAFCKVWTKVQKEKGEVFLELTHNLGHPVSF